MPATAERRRAPGRLDVGLILPGVPPAGRLEPAGVTSADDIDPELTRWLRAAYARAG